MILQTESLTKAFGGLMAVNGVTLEVKEGDLHAIIGPNGAGKTTFFNLVTNYLPADSGRIIFKGKDITKSPPHEICKMGIAKSFLSIKVHQRLRISANSIMMVAQRLRS